MRGCLVALSLFVSVATARADDDRQIGVIVASEAALEGEVMVRVEQWLKAHEYRLVASAMSQDAENTFANCLVLDDLKCARGVFEARVKPGRLLYASVTVDNDNYTIDLYWFAKGHDPIHEQQPCEKCEPGAWHRTADAMLTRLEAAGQLPIVEEPKPVTPRGRKRGSRVWPALLVGAGVATLATGGVFLYYGTNDDASQKYIYPDSTPVGITLLAVGGAAAIGGAILLIQAGPSSSGPVAAAGRDSGYLGWTGRF